VEVSPNLQLRPRRRPLIPPAKTKILPIIRNSLETVRDRMQLSIFTNTNSDKGFRTVSKSVTLNDHEQRNYRRCSAVAELLVSLLLLRIPSFQYLCVSVTRWVLSFCYRYTLYKPERRERCGLPSINIERKQTTNSGPQDGAEHHGIMLQGCERTIMVTISPLTKLCPMSLSSK